MLKLAFGWPGLTHSVVAHPTASSSTPRIPIRTGMPSLPLNDWLISGCGRINDDRGTVKLLERLFRQHDQLDAAVPGARLRREVVRDRPLLSVRRRGQLFDRHAVQLAQHPRD